MPELDLFKGDKPIIRDYGMQPKHFDMEATKLDNNLYREAISEGIDVSHLTSDKAIKTALDNKKAEQQEQIIFGMEVLGIILVILAAFLWLRKRNK